KSAHFKSGKIFAQNNFLGILGGYFGGKFRGKNALGGMNGGSEKASYVCIWLLVILPNSMILNKTWFFQLHKKSDTIPPYSIWRSNAAFT
ncbi:hypothetical protein D6G19_19830, partial [Salmonella enterica]|nr:hypothetical protein [Salmonella enterica]